MTNPIRVFVAVPLIALLNAILVGLSNGVYNLIADTNPLIKWPGSFWVYFWYTLIFASFIGFLLAPIMVWLGSKMPQPKLRYLIGIGLIVGPLPLLFLFSEGLSIDGGIGLVVFSLLGGFSAVIWWHIVEKHRVVWETDNV